MSTPSNDNSDIKQAAEQVDVQQIEKNLEDNKPTDVPEQLTEDQQVPFIDEEVRTDK
ncbi:hypothetical protein [Psychrobacter frigidicola]|uniref:hypothetical protein n=1 Tax=Psychrobacter frigidicola TaxID=45611 RepID=UPI001918F82D|nr:hypothetical protein [Psychrobacter frigidicola]